MHCSTLNYGFMLDSFLGSSLNNLNSTLGMVLDAYKCCNEVGYKNKTCYGAIINNLVLNLNGETAMAPIS